MENFILSPIPLSELVKEIEKAVRVAVATQSLERPTVEEDLLTRAQTATLLGITLPTLRLYTKRGLITGYRIGSRIRYRRSEILDSLQRLRFSRRA